MSPVKVVSKDPAPEALHAVELSLRPLPKGPQEHAGFSQSAGSAFMPLLTSEIRTLEFPKAWIFGDPADTVLELAALTRDSGAIELGYYYGDKKPKSIIKISSQIGCPASCTFCEVGEERFSRNLTPQEIYEQVALVAQIAAAQPMTFEYRPHKVSVAGTGEPLLNPHLIEGLQLLAPHKLSFKISTVAPASRITTGTFLQLADFAGSYQEPVQVQISLISTSEQYRKASAGVRLASFQEIRELGQEWRARSPKRGQINLSLILSEDTPVDVREIAHVFPRDLFRFRFRTYVRTENGSAHNLRTISETRLLAIKSEFRLAGYEVSDDATPTPTEMEYKLASNVTRRRMMRSFGVPVHLKRKIPV